MLLRAVVNLIKEEIVKKEHAKGKKEINKNIIRANCTVVYVQICPLAFACMSVHHNVFCPAVPALATRGHVSSE